jgi:hypothetical protein
MNNNNDTSNKVHLFGIVFQSATQAAATIIAALIMVTTISVVVVNNISHDGTDETIIRTQVAIELTQTAIAGSGNSTQAPVIITPTPEPIQPSNTPTVVTSEPTATNTPTATYQQIPLELGIEQAELQMMINNTTTVAELLVELDNYYNIHPQHGGAWSTPGATVAGKAVFWTDLFDNGYDLPEGITHLRTQGSWGIYLIEASFLYQIPSPNAGGRYLLIID